jgi:hypothetical protein
MSHDGAGLPVVDDDQIEVLITATSKLAEAQKGSLCTVVN